MSNIFERFGILNASEIKLFSKSTDKLILKILQGNSLSLEVKSDSKSAKEQGVEAITWNLAKTGSMKLSTETTSFAQLAEALGSNGLKLNTDSETYDRSETFTVTSNGSITINLANEPMVSSVVSFHKLTLDGELGDELTAVVDVTDKKKFTITDSKLKINDIIEVNYIESLTAGKVYTFKVSGKGGNTEARRLVANVLCKNRVDGSMRVMQLVVPNVVLENSMTLTFDADTPSKFELTLKVMADAILKDENGDPLFFELKSLSDIVGTITPITDLIATPADDSATFTFTAPTGASSVKLMIKKSSDSTYVDSGISLTNVSTTVTVSGLVDATSYNAKLIVVGGEHEGESNVVTFTTL
ncbi:hypothetical protein [Clostridium beijerinckii]|uniref:hypothetical protein n=1 Tax=Clostridium beijerinckii TaxID=1520 RepID=UPI00156F580F|nr:hypothetical protein [Clostridium beijerinckii]NRU52564.1 hypothetical protein [Clostridium beijerinckii]NYC69259.1 hypothetical protein [Clostridium beijerinckii]NYC91765.1 hypothetical protein [Clostridium beijerinckii]